MRFPETSRPVERPILRVLVAGFALVVILLVLAGGVALQGTRAIEEGTAQVIREELVISRLLNDVQVEQNALAAILHRISHPTGTVPRDELLASLDSADRALNRIADLAAETPEAELWRTLQQGVSQFSTTLRGAMAQRRLSDPELLTELFDQHDQVVDMEQELLSASETRIDSTAQRIEAESQSLANRSRILLGAGFVLALLCAGLTVAFARRSIRRMEWQTQELTRVSWRMLEGQEAAARRFSHELHDELGQALAAIKANITSSDVNDWKTRRIDCLQVVDDAIWIGRWAALAD